MENHGVIVGYLFGSVMRGTMGPRSDIDVAVFFDNTQIPETEQFKETLALSADIAQAFSVENVDVINLNSQTNPVLRYEAVVNGEAIFVKDPSVKTQLARAILREYENTRYLRETSYRILREQIKSGLFGRAPVKSQSYVSTQ